MNILNTIPLVGAILAFLLGVFVVLNTNQNKRARWTLFLITLLSAHSLLESFLFYNELSWPGLGLSYLHYHLIGALFLLYTYFLFRIDVNLTRWAIIIVGFTLLRLMLLAPVDEDVLELTTGYTPEIIGLIIDNLLSILLNIGLLYLAFLKISKVHFAIQLSPVELVNYKWLKSLLLISIGLYAAILVSSFISIFDEEWLFYFKIESVINSIFSLTLVFCSLRFPVFSIHGDYRDLSPGAKQKYAKSSLTTEQSVEIWNQLDKLFEVEKPYLNAEYRLNDLAEKLGRSVHHVSQSINEQRGLSFSDIVSQYRVEEAKALLRSDRAKQVTILAIAYESGFNSKTAFYNTFKKVTGQSPSEFLKDQEAITG